MKSLKSWIKKIPLIKKYRINKWKKYSQRILFSNKEVTKLEKNPELISEAIRNHIKTNSYVPKDIYKELDNIIEIYASRNKITMSKDKLKEDMLFWYFAYGFSFNEYLCYQFVNKNNAERMEFMSDRESVLMGYDFNDIDAISVFADKMNTYKMYEQYYGREAISIESEDDFEKFKRFIKKHRKFVKKDVLKACGESVELIDLDKANNISEKELFIKFINEGKIILEEVVEQSDKISVFNSSSVNTIRCITVNTKKGIELPFTFMKIGREGAFIDNGRAGGILVGINPKTGVLSTDGVDENGIRYLEHPDSHKTFNGFQLPNWEELIKLSKEMSALAPKVKMIGWDFAHTNNGWVVIEGNAMTEVIGPQSTWLKGIRKDILEIKKQI